MEFNKALAQISEIHAHLDRAEVYRGFRALPVALSGAVGIVAAVVVQYTSVASDPFALVRYWMGVGACCAAIAGVESAVNYARREDAFSRRRTRRTLGQFVPTLCVGLALAVLLPRAGEQFVPLLPGLWAMAFGLGLFAARPYLPRATGWIAFWYLAAGCLWMAAPLDGFRYFSWAVGGTFGAGQLLGALVLLRNVERTCDE
ncbi:MAG TPA: hypothetical protein VGJ26_00245 [Pirellulales bacterium]|jgi:hypothetical protein